MSSSAREPSLLLALTDAAGETRTRLLQVLARECAQRGENVAWHPAPADAKALDLLILEPATPATLAALRAEPAPRVVVCGAAPEELPALAAALGRPFDAEFAAADPAAGEQLARACSDLREWTQLGRWGGASGALEMSLGSVLHAVKVPLRGAALCSVQAATLTFASAPLRQPGRVAWVAFISAGLKAFSPGGGRIRPMVAITVQGSLFAALVQALGWNLASVALGGACIGAWAALQGFLLQYLLLGQELLVAYARLVQWLAETWQITAPSMPVLLAGWTALHATLAASAAGGAARLRRPPAAVEAALRRSAVFTAPASAQVVAGQNSRARRIAREFARWQFWLPLALVAGVLLASGRPVEQILWLAARFVAVGALLFALLSFYRPAALARWLRRRGWWGPAAAFSAGHERIGPR